MTYWAIKYMPISRRDGGFIDYTTIQQTRRRVWEKFQMEAEKYTCDGKQWGAELIARKKAGRIIAVKIKIVEVES